MNTNQILFGETYRVMCPFGTLNYIRPTAVEMDEQGRIVVVGDELLLDGVPTTKKIKYTIGPDRWLEDWIPAVPVSIMKGCNARPMVETPIGIIAAAPCMEPEYSGLWLMLNDGHGGVSKFAKVEYDTNNGRLQILAYPKGAEEANDDVAPQILTIRSDKDKENSYTRQLAKRLISFLSDVDLYGYKDNLEIGEIDEDAVRQMEADLQNPVFVNGLILSLNKWYDDLHEEKQRTECMRLLEAVKRHAE